MIHHRHLFPLVLFFSSGCALSGWFAPTSSEFHAAVPTELKARLSAEDDRPNGKVDHWAVLIGANSELRHQGNLSMAYQVLIEQGYDREHVFILDSEGATPFFPVTDFTTRESVQLLFDHLANVVGPEDTLFVYVTGHGKRIKADEVDNGKPETLAVSTLLLNPGEEMSEDEFVSRLEAVQPSFGIVFFDQCYAGPPVTRTTMCNYVFITTADSETTSFGNQFPRAFWSAFRERRRALGPPSLVEAFKHAMVIDRGTRLGFNRPKLTHGCIDPSTVSLLGPLPAGAGGLAAGPHVVSPPPAPAPAPVDPTTAVGAPNGAAAPAPKAP